MSEQRIAPGLLLAMPQLDDPNFKRSVVLMVQHNAESSLGLIVNRPSESVISEVLNPMGVVWGGDPSDLVWSGGPVMPRSGWLLHGPDEEVADDEGTLDVTEDVWLTTSPKNLGLLAERPPRHSRFLMGYAGWGGGQLEGVVAGGSWLSIEVSAQLIFETPHDEMWEAALRSIGVDPGSLFPAFGVH